MRYGGCAAYAAHMRIQGGLAALAIAVLAPAASARTIHTARFTLGAGQSRTVELGRHPNIQLTSVRVNGHSLLAGDQQGADAFMYGWGVALHFNKHGRAYRVIGASVNTATVRVTVRFYGYPNPR